MMEEPRDKAVGSTETPTVEVRVFRDGELIRRELCDSEDDAALVVDEWSEVDGIEVEVDDLTIVHRPGDILAPEPPEPRDGGYPYAHEAGDR